MLSVGEQVVYKENNTVITWSSGYQFGVYSYDQDGDFQETLREVGSLSIDGVKTQAQAIQAAEEYARDVLSLEEISE